MATSESITALYDHWLGLAAVLSDTEDRLQCELALSRWKDVQTAVAALETQGLQSYSMGGNSYSRRDVPTLIGQADALRSEIRAYVSGSGSYLVDNSRSEVRL